MMPQVFVESQAEFASVNEAAATHDLGTLAWNYNSTYKSWQLLKYVQMVGAVTGAEGGVCCVGDSYGTVTPDINSDQISATTFGGALLGVVTVDYYCWVCVGGTALCTGDNVNAAGEYVVNAAAVDLQMDTMADGEEEQVFGIVLVAATTAAPTVPVSIRPSW